jgi:hypothetical protein
MYSNVQQCTATGGFSTGNGGGWFYNRPLQYVDGKTASNNANFQSLIFGLSERTDKQGKGRRFDYGIASRTFEISLVYQVSARVVQESFTTEHLNIQRTYKRDKDLG